MHKALIVFCVALATVTAWADDAASKLDAVKAAYVFRISSFAVWPQNTTLENITLCIAGEHVEGIATVLAEKTAGRKIKGRDIVVRYLSRYDEQEAAGCDTLYLAEGANRSWFVLPETLFNRLLIISDPSLSLAGISLIRLFMKGGNIVFAVDSDVLKRSQLQLPASLLSLAQKDD